MRPRKHLVPAEVAAIQAAMCRALNARGACSPETGGVEFDCETKDGKTGQVKIDGVAYKLADGNLFLVLTEGERSRVKQLKRDMTNLKFERESLEAFGRNDPEIADFFTKGARAK